MAISNEERLKRARERMRRLRENPEYRARQNERQRERLKNPEAKARKKEQDRAYYERPEVRERVLKRQAERRPDYRARPGIRERERERYREYMSRPENHERKRRWTREYCQRPDVKEKLSKLQKVYRDRPANRERARKYMREYWPQYNRKRYRNDPAYRLTCIVRGRLNRALKDRAKNGSAVKLLGCTVEQAVIHLESQFRDGMTWKNWSRFGWHVDHIKPLASFNLEDETELQEACHYTNLQPLWWYENIRKGAS